MRRVIAPRRFLGVLGVLGVLGTMASSCKARSRSSTEPVASAPKSTVSSVSSMAAPSSALASSSAVIDEGAPPTPQEAPELMPGAVVLVRGDSVCSGVKQVETDERFPNRATTVAGPIAIVNDTDASIQRTQVLVLGSRVIYPPTCPPKGSDDTLKTCQALRDLHTSFMESVGLVVRMPGPSADETTILAKATTAGNVCYGGGPLFFLRIHKTGTVTYFPPIDHCMGGVELTRSGSTVTLRLLAHEGRTPFPGTGEQAPKFPEETVLFDLTAGTTKRQK